MTTYGSIPMDSQALSSRSFVAHARGQIESSFSAQRPWQELIQFNSFALPISFSSAMERIRTNTLFFWMNYTIIIFCSLFLSLLWNPFNLTAFAVLVMAWLFLFFLRNDDPLEIYGCLIHDAVVLMVLLVLTIGLLSFTNVTNGIIVGLSAGVAVILAHGLFRSTDDLSIEEDDEEKIRPQSKDRIRMKNPASVSFSSS